MLVRGRLWAGLRLILSWCALFVMMGLQLLELVGCEDRSELLSGLLVDGLASAAS